MLWLPSGAMVRGGVIVMPVCRDTLMDMPTALHHETL